MKLHLEEVEITPITRLDDPGVADLIRSVMPEFGANGPGFAIADPEVQQMSVAYGVPRSGYWVVKNQSTILGAGGYAQLTGASETICELRKMYFRQELRGKGFGSKLMEIILEAAGRDKFERCYLETLETMQDAQKLYMKFGFKRLEKPMGSTGHFGCDRWYARDL